LDAKEYWKEGVRRTRSEFTGIRRQLDLTVGESRLDQGRVKGESAVDVDRGETELLAADVLRDEAVAVDGHTSEIRVVMEVAKGKEQCGMNMLTDEVTVGL
jgi:hypothetical protein